MRISVALVESVDDEVKIEANDPIEYKWVIQRIDFEPALLLEKQNKELKDELQRGYRDRIRHSYREQVLRDLPDANRERLSLILSGAPTPAAREA